MAGQVLAVASGKGGVGKTTTVVNLGVVLRRADHTVALVDADLGMANLGTMLGVSAETTLHDVLSGSASVEEALVEEAPGFGVLVGSGDLTAYPDATPEGLGEVLDALAATYDYVLVDTGAGMSHEDVLPLGLADRVVLVTSPDPAAVGDTQKTAELAGLARGDLAGVVVTMADDSTDEADIAEQVGADLLGVVPFDPAVRSSTASATPLEAADPEGAAATAYRELATTLEALPVSPTETEAVEEAIADAADTPADSGSEDEIEPAATAEADDAAADPEPPADASPGAVEAEAADDAEPDDDELAEADEPGAGSDGPAESTDGTDEEPPSDGDDEAPTDEEEPAEPDEAAAGSTDDEPAEASEAGGEEVADAADESGEDDEEEDLDDYLEEFEDVEPAPSGGFFAKLRRLLR